MVNSTDESSGGSGALGAATSIFGESISGWKVEQKNRRQAIAAQEDLSSDITRQAKPGTDRLHERKKVHAEAELSRVATMAEELERQVEQINARARLHRSELRGTRATSRRKKGLEAPSTPESSSSNTRYTEVMEELDRVKKELCKLKLEVKSAREAKGKAERDVEESMTSSLHIVGDMNHQRGEVMEEHVQRDVSQEKDLEAKLAVMNSDVELLQPEIGLVRAVETNHVKNGAVEATTARKNKEEAQGKASLQAAETELNEARIELASIREEGFQFTTSIDHTRSQILRVTDQFNRVKAQERKVDAQVQRLNAKLLNAKSRMEAVAAADERAKATVAKLTTSLQRLHVEVEASKKEKELTELENRCVRAETEDINHEIAMTEERIRLSVKELEAVKASEAAAMKKLKDVVARASSQSETLGTVTISRFEYEYLSARPASVRAVADKKVAAAQAWVEALKAGEKEITMRAKAIEREIREMGAKDANTVSEVEKSVDDHKAMELKLFRLKSSEAERNNGFQSAHQSRSPVSGIEEVDDEESAGINGGLEQALAVDHHRDEEEGDTILSETYQDEEIARLQVWQSQETL